MTLLNIVSGGRESMSHCRRDRRPSLRLGDTVMRHPTRRLPANSDDPMYEKMGLASGFFCLPLVAIAYVHPSH